MTENNKTQYSNINTNNTKKDAKYIEKSITDKALINEDGMLSAFGFNSPVVDLNKNKIK